MTTTGSTTFSGSVKTGGNVSVNTGTFQLDGQMNAGTNAVSITATGTATEGVGGSITASTLALQGSGGNYSFANTANSVTTLAANTGQITFTNAGALTVGSVGSVNGVTATGPVAVVTQSGNLTVSQNIATTDTSSAAIVLNAGKSAGAGTSSGGDVVLSGSPMFFTGAGGRFTLLTGSLSGSTGVAGLIGSGSGHFRYNSDETATNYTAVLGTGAYAVYRERPSVSVAVSNASMTYGDALPAALITVTGAQNGDTATQIVNGQTAIGGTTSASGNLIAGSHAVSVSSAAEQLGYLISNSASGTLTVNQRPINITTNAGQSKIYGDADPALAYALEANSSGRGIVAGDTFSGALARAAGETVGSGYAISQGTLADSNYAIGFTGANFAITQRPVTLMATPVSKIYGDADPGLAVTVTVGSLASAAQTDTLADVTGTLSRQSGNNVGAYNILLGTGTKAGNYAITFNAANSAFTIGKRTVTLTASKTYDGSTGLTGFVTLGNFAGSETLTYSGAASFSKDVASNATNYVSAITLADGSGGGLASNYQLPTLNHANAPVTVSQKTLTVTGSKTYDGTANLLGYLTLGGFVGSETVGYSAATASSSHVATANKYVSAITLTDGLNGGLAGNYQIPGSYNATTNAVTINAATLTPTISNTGVTKVYDGSTSTTLTPTYTFAGLVSGDTAATLTNTGKAYDSKDVATASTITVSGLGISTITGSNGSAASDYVLDATSKTVAATITKQNVSVTSIQVADKIYDGTANATSVQSTVLSGVIAADSANVNTTGTLSAFSGKDVGSYSVSVTGMSLTGSAAGNYNLTSSTATDSSVAITPKTVTLSAAKTYDGTTGLSGFVSLGGFIGSETLSYSGAAASDGHVATAGKYVNAITLANGTNGGLASNYQLPTLNTANTPVTITAKTLTPTISNTGVTKVYDGDTTTTLTPTYTFAGLVSNDTSAALTNTGKVYDSKDVATASTITVSGLAISGITGSNSSQASDYVLDATSKTVAATITQKDVSVTSIQIADKVYDGTANATSVQSTVLSGVIAADSANVNTTGTLSAFSGKDVGAYSISVTGMSLTGTAAGNYNLTSGTATDSSVAITPRTVTLSAAKTYDGTTDLSGFVTMGGFIGSETLSYTGATANDSHVATAGKYVNAITLANGTNGGLAGNYQLPTLNAANAPVTINAATLTPTISNTGVTKVYDGSTSTTLTPTYTFAGLVSGDTAATLTNTGKAYDSKDVATASTITVGGLAITGITGSHASQASDYVLDATSKTVAGTITARTLNVSYTGVSRVYDGTANATVTSTDDRVSGDVLAVSGTAGFADKNVGVGKTVSVSGASLSGTDAGNYVLAGTTGSTVANITARTLNVSYTGVSRVYDGTIGATVTTADDRVSGDVLTIGRTASFADKNVGTGKTVSISGGSLSGADAGNYVLAGTTGSTTANITPKPLSLSGLTAANKSYDGNTNATISNYGSLSGVIAGDAVTLDTGAAVASFADPNPGIGKTVNVASLQLAGLDIGNYLFGAQTTTADINSTVPPPQVPTGNPQGNAPTSPGNRNGGSGTGNGGDPFTPPPLFDGGGVPQVPPVVDGGTGSTVGTVPSGNDASGGGSGAGSGSTASNPNGNPGTNTTVNTPGGGSTTTTTDPNGGTTTSTTVANPNGGSTTTTTGSDGSTTQSTTTPNPNGGSTAQSTTTDPNGTTTTSTTVTNPNGGSTTTTRSPDGSSTTTQSGNGGLSVGVTYPDGTAAKTTYAHNGGSETQVTNSDGSSVSVAVSADGKVTTSKTARDGRTTREAVDVDSLPIVPVVVKLSLVQVALAHGDGILLLDRLRSVDSSLVAVAMVSGEGGMPLPAELRYDRSTGRLYVRGGSGWSPFYVLAIDRNGNVKRFKVELQRITKE